MLWSTYLNSCRNESVDRPCRADVDLTNLLSVATEPKLVPAVGFDLKISLTIGPAQAVGSTDVGIDDRLAVEGDGPAEQDKQRCHVPIELGHVAGIERDRSSCGIESRYLGIARADTYVIGLVRL